MRKQENCCKKFYVADVPGVSFSREATYPAIPCFSKIDCEACPFYEEEKEETLEFLGYNLSWYKEACKKYDELHLLD